MEAIFKEQQLDLLSKWLALASRKVNFIVEKSVIILHGFQFLEKDFDIVCRAILDLNLRYQGYLLVCDSWYTSIPMMLQLFY